MDVVGSEIGQKMRSAIKAKLTELGCYVDDELPDYVMVMVANKRTRAQMEDDLQLFLGDNTELFVNWLHQVLKKLQEVTITTPAKTAEAEKVKEKTKDKKSKDKKEKGKLKKIEGVKKAKKKVKSKSHKKKDSDDKKPHKSKKKSKHHEMIRPNVPPLLMNMEKDSEPSITDIFAGQILKNHGVSIADTPKEKPADIKPVIAEIKRPILPIIDPATISTQPELDTTDNDTESSQIEVVNEETNRASVSSAGAPREDQIKEMSEIEAKIQGLKQKLAEQLDSMSDDEDFLNIRTEAEELMNDFAEDVFMEISSQAPVATPPIQSKKSPSPPIPTPKLPEPPKDPEVLPQIELNLPKRPVRERLGTREETKKPQEIKEKKSDKRTDSPERFTPEREPDFWPKGKSARSRLGSAPEPPKRITVSDDAPDDAEVVSKRLTSKVSTLEKRPRATCASVVRVRPRPRVAAPASSLLMRAVADAHKSLLNIPPKSDSEPHKVKRALVLPMRRCIDTQNIVIQVHGDGHVDSDGDDKSSKVASDVDKDEYVPSLMTKKVVNSDYVPSRRSERTSTRRDDTLIIETINIHKTTAEKDKNTQFIVTMDGFNPNSFLAKKLENEGLLKDSEEIKDKPAESKPILKATEDSKLKTDVTARNPTETKLKSTEIRRNSTELELEIPEVICADSVESTQDSTESNLETTESNLETTENVADTVQLDEKVVETEELKTIQQKRLSNTSDESDTQVIITREADRVEKRLSNEARSSESSNVEESPPVKKRKASPIVFNVSRKEKQEEKKERERTESVGSDSHVTVTTVLNTHKYDAVPSLSQAERKLVWCRLFPLCRYGAACAFQHPRCKFAAGCTRRNCVYAHGPQRLGSPATPPPAVASHVVPAANFKSITPGTLPTVCKYYPSCANPSCPYWHPKPCRYGPACANRLECNFYHSDGPAHKWRYPV